MEEACMIYHGDRVICISPSERLLRILGKQYTLLIIALLGNRGDARFNEILRQVGNPRPNLLSTRLKELEDAGLVRRAVGEGRPPPVSYSLTEDGVRLRDLLLPILEWIEMRSTAEIPGPGGKYSK